MRTDRQTANNSTRHVDLRVDLRRKFFGGSAAWSLKGGLSNESWKVTDAQGVHVVRFGKDYPVHHVDRAREAFEGFQFRGAKIFGPR